MRSHTVKQFLVTAGIALALAGCAGTAKQESTGQYIDDATITARVRSEFVRDEKVGAARINVETYKGVVQLSGFANSPDEAQRAVQIVRNTPGVKGVRNDIAIK